MFMFCMQLRSCRSWEVANRGGKQREEKGRPPVWRGCSFCHWPDVKWSEVPVEEMVAVLAACG